MLIDESLNDGQAEHTLLDRRAGGTGRFNVALGANGAVATATRAHTCCRFSTTALINRGPWGSGEGWNDATPNSTPDWIQVNFAGSKTIDEIDVFSLHDN